MSDGTIESTVQFFDEALIDTLDGEPCKSAAEHERVYFLRQMRRLTSLAHETADRLPEMQGEIVALLRELVDGLSAHGARGELSD